MRLAGLLIGPVILALLIVMSAARLSSALSEPVSEPPTTQASGLVWDGRVFTTRAAFAKWLDERGLSIRAWERRHPASPWTTAKETQAAPAVERREVALPSEQESRWFVLALGGALALIAGVTGAAAVHRRRDRPIRPMSTNGASRGRLTAPRPSLAVAAVAVQRGVVEAASPRVHTASVAAQRGIELARPRLEGAGSAARQGLGAAFSRTAELSRRVRYEIKTERFRVVLFYVLAALFSAAIALAVAIAAA